jgi:hypothetical protein
VPSRGYPLKSFSYDCCPDLKHENNDVQLGDLAFAASNERSETFNIPKSIKFLVNNRK